jgi:cobalt-zinc-cadmium efflux system protein
LGLLVMAVVIFYEAILRLKQPESVQSGPMIWVALAAIVLNSTIAWWLSAAAKKDLNIRSAYMHMLGDAAASLAVVLAGVVIAVTGAYIADPIVSIVFALLVLWSSWGILQESISILMESMPFGMDLQVVEQAVLRVAGVIEVHDVHIWALSSGLLAGSCHVVLQDQSLTSSEPIRQAVEECLAHDFNIAYCTIQIEARRCGEHAHFEHE